MRMATAPQSHSTTPWYRNGWVWFLICIPGSAVIAGSITILIAVKTADSLVADDYYKEGRAINQRLEKDDQAKALGVSLQSSIKKSVGGHRIELQFAAKPGTAAPQSIHLLLSHPTLNHRDVKATLVKSGAATYTTEVPGLAAGKWYAQLEDSESVWRVKSTWTVE